MKSALQSLAMEVQIGYSKYRYRLGCKELADSILALLARWDCRDFNQLMVLLWNYHPRKYRLLSLAWRISRVNSRCTICGSNLSV